MHDEFRVRVHVAPDSIRALLAQLAAMSDDSEDRVAVTSDADDVFLYVDSQESAGRALAAVNDALATGAIQGEVTSSRWHPLEERWEDAAAPLPDSDEARALELQRRRDAERAESSASGRPEWELRIHTPTLAAARELAAQLREQDLQPIRRWRYLLVGAASEEDANELAARVASLLPQGSRIQVEGSATLALDSTPVNPFAFFGGLGQ
jgi:hypothetical protein